MSNFQLYKKAISATGTTTENEPIIKSDGASSDVMQWLSNDESSNVTISEDGSNNLDLVVSAGNVGVGVSPDGTDWNANAKVVHAYQNDSDGAMFKAESSSASLIVSAGNTQAQIGTVEAVPLRFYTSNAERLSIDSAGMLVTQAAGIIGTASSSGSLTMYGGSSWPGGKIVLSGGNSPSTGDIKFYTGVSTETPTERLSISATGLTTVTNPGWPLKNEISNSGFDCWSNSTLEDATGTELVDNGDFATTIALSDWTKYEGGGGGSVAVVSNELKFTQVTSATMTCQQGVTTVEGKLYRLTYDQKTQSSANYTKVTVGTGSGGASSYDIRNPSWSTSAEGATTYTFEAESATTYITIWDGQTNGETSTWDDVTLKEVTPGVLGGTRAADGWGAGSVDTYREHWNGSGGDSDTTKTGSFYALKMVNASSSGYVEQLLDLGKFRGRTITLGVWVKTSTGDAARTKINGTVTTDVWSDYATDSDNWEWLETTMNVSASETYLLIQLRTEVASTVYWSQPILSLGSAIGEGNYSRPSGEIVWCETAVGVQSNLSPISTDDKVLNLESLSNGKIPKGAKAINLRVSVRNNIVASGQGVEYGPSSAYSEWLQVFPMINTYTSSAVGWVDCDSNGDIYQKVTETGLTLAGLYNTVKAIQLR